MLDSVILGVSLGLYNLSGRTFPGVKEIFLRRRCIYCGIEDEQFSRMVESLRFITRIIACTQEKPKVYTD